MGWGGVVGPDANAHLRLRTVFLLRRAWGAVRRAVLEHCWKKLRQNQACAQSWTHSQCADGMKNVFGDASHDWYVVKKDKCWRPRKEMHSIIRTCFGITWLAVGVYRSIDRCWKLCKKSIPLACFLKYCRWCISFGQSLGRYYAQKYCISLWWRANCFRNGSPIFGHKLLHQHVSLATVSRAFFHGQQMIENDDFC